MSNPRPDQPPVDLEAVCRCANPHQHGELRTILRHGCHCRPCLDAQSSRQRARYRAHAYGRPPKVDATAARQHLLALVEAGMGHERIAAAGLARQTVERIISGRAVTCTRRIHEVIMAIAPNPRMVPTVGARRRIQALALLGWTNRDLAPLVGRTPESLAATMRRSATISRDLHERIASVHSRLWDTPAPVSAASKRVRTEARLKGWAPTAAWDDIDHDDAPSLGDTTVRTGRGAVSRIHPDDIAWMLRTERTSHASAERLGVTRAYLLELAQRHGIDIPAHIRVGDEERAQMRREGKAA